MRIIFGTVGGVAECLAHAFVVLFTLQTFPKYAFARKFEIPALLSARI